MTSSEYCKAVVWDYDGTLVDTGHKNLHVTRAIIQEITGDPAARFKALESLESYLLANKSSANWRDLYRKEFGLTEAQVDRAGMLWSEYQLRDHTHTPLIAGIRKTLALLNSLPQGIFSQNSRPNIYRSLQRNGVADYFRSIIGYEEVDFSRQKPHPEGLFMCLKEIISFDSGYVFFIGDHETDARCARNAGSELRENGSNIRMVSIGAFYGTAENDSAWTVKPDYQAHSPGEIADIVLRHV